MSPVSSPGGGATGARPAPDPGPPAAPWAASVATPLVRFGPGALAGLGSLVRELHASRALLVTDEGVRAAGHAGRAEASLREAGVRARVFAGVAESPTARDVEGAVRAALGFGVDCIVAIGGGSALDAAKGANLLLTNGGRIEDYLGTGRASRPLLPSVGVPTTAGSGSEARSVALIGREGSGGKVVACGDDRARFRAVILDPDLAATAPRRVASLSGMSAIGHAVESYVATRRNPLSQMLARDAWRRLAGALLPSLEGPGAGDARGEMLLGAFLAGAAVDASMLGAAHACAAPLTARFAVAGGAAVLLMLPHVVRFNEPAVGGLYEELLAAAPGREATSLASLLERLRRASGLPERLRDVGVSASALPDLAREASEQATLAFNPRRAGETEIRQLYEQAH